MTKDLQSAFRALSDPTRRAILMQLREKDLTITEVVAQFELTRTAVRKHLTILEQGDLIKVTPKGRERVTQLNPNGVKSTAEWFSHFDQFWDTALNSLKHAVESDSRKKSIRRKK